MSSQKLFCDICVVDYSTIHKKYRNKICEYECGISMCWDCTKRCLTEYNKLNAVCISCSREWSYKYVKNLHTIKWFNKEWRIYQAELLLQREIARLPTTQIYVNRILSVPSLQSDIHKLSDTITQLTRQRSQLQRQVNLITMYPYQLDKSVKESVTKFIKACPQVDCRGFLSTNWNCSICKVWVCSDCHIIKKCQVDEEHSCDPDLVATATFIMKDTKQCPQCHVHIHKIDGCDQMWCINCHTPFSYRTGLRETGTIHNPEFYRWQREQSENGLTPIVHNQNECLPLIQHITRFGVKCRPFISQQQIEMLHNIHRMILHIQNVEYIKYPNVTDPCERIEYRVNYMLQKLDVENWTKNILISEKKRNKNKELHMIFELCSTVFQDLINQLVNTEPTTIEIWDTFFQMAHKFKEYVNTNIKEIINRYDSHANRVISNTFNLI